MLVTGVYQRFCCFVCCEFYILGYFVDFGDFPDGLHLSMFSSTESVQFGHFFGTLMIIELRLA